MPQEPLFLLCKPAEVLLHARVAQLLEDGMRTLKQDGMEKGLQGLTDMKHVRAVCIK